MLKKILHEPLLHFLLLGGLIFLFYSFLQDTKDNANSIIISNDIIEKLTLDFEKKSLSVLTADEKQKLIDNEIYQTILYSEALKAGLDKSDVDMKKHLVDKMSFIIYDTYVLPIPSDEVLKKFMLEYPKDYRKEQKVHFTQSLIGSDKESFKKEYTLSMFEANNIFGASFSEMLFELMLDGKVYKIESEYGVHEVMILNKRIPQLKLFDDAREALKSDYLKVQREKKNKVIYEELKSQYDISIEEK